MKPLRVYTVAACVASIAAAGCSTTGVNTPGVPRGGAATIHHHLSHPVGTITEYTIPDDGKSHYKPFPIGITNGPDGAIWFTERGWGELGRITTDGTMTQYSLQVGPDDPSRFPQNVTTGPDGNLWVTCGSVRTQAEEDRFAPDEYGSVRQMAPSGTVLNVIQLPTNYSDPRTITTGPDGNLWFTEARGAIGQVSTGAVLLNEFLVQGGNRVYPIAVGPDQNLWFGEILNGIIAQITTSGTITYFTLPKDAGPEGIVAGPDGYLYISEINAGKVAQLRTAGVINNEWDLGKNTAPKGITFGSDGNLYIAESGTSKIAEIVLQGSLYGTINEFPTPTGSSGPWKVTSGPDGNIWFTEASKGKIGQLMI